MAIRDSNPYTNTFRNYGLESLAYVAHGLGEAHKAMLGVNNAKADDYFYQVMAAAEELHGRGYTHDDEGKPVQLRSQPRVGDTLARMTDRYG